MKNNDKDWGKIIFRIVIVLFIIFFISRWFKLGDSDRIPAQDQPPSIVITEDEEEAPKEEIAETGTAVEEPIRYEFRNQNLLDKHYEKHGIEMGFASAEEYEAAASAVVTNPNALHKLEQEDGDDVFYLEATREFVVVSTDGFIRTYYYANKDYFERQ